MISLRAWCMRLRELFRGEQLDRELTDELTAHLEMHLADNVRAGMQPEEARRVALLKLGGLEQTKETVRDRRGLPVLEAFLQDASYAVRSLLRSPGITLVALLSLALGIGANTAIFSLMNAVLLKSLPVRDPAQLVLFGDGLDQGISDGFPNPWLYSYPFYREMQKDNQVFSGVAAAFSMNDRIHGFVTGRHEAEPMNVQLVSGTYFPLLGVQAVMGRTLSEQDDQTEGDHPVAVVSYAWFQRHFNGNPAAIGKVIRILDHDYTLIGVARPGFSGVTADQPADLWIPLSMQKEISPGWNGLERMSFQSLYLIARLKPGVSWQSAGAGANLLFQEILRSDFVGPNPSPKDLASIQHAQIDLTSAARGISQLRSYLPKIASLHC